MARRINPHAEPGALQMTAAELVQRYASGGRFRLVAPSARLYHRTVADKVDGAWPLIVAAEYPGDGLTPEIVVVVQCPLFVAPDGSTNDRIGYDARANDDLVVIPVHPARCLAEIAVAAEAGASR